MNINHESAAVELAVAAAARLAQGLDDSEQRLELSEWVEMNLGKLGLLQRARRLALATDAAAYSYLVRVLRLVGSVQEVRTGDTKEVLCLVGIPLFLRGKPQEKLSRLPDWEVRQRIERRLEEVLKIRMLSVRLNRFPVESVPLGGFSPAHLQKLVLDLNEYGDSRLLDLPRMEMDADGFGLIWPGIVRFRAEAYEEEYAHFRKQIVSPCVKEFRDYASRELSEALQDYIPEVRAVVYPPVPHADALSTYRLLRLLRTVESMATHELRSVIYRFKGGLLTLWLLGAEDVFLSVFEMDFSEDNPYAVQQTVNRLQRKLGIPLTAVSELPPLPAEAAAASR